MDAERSIALGTYCDIDQHSLIDSIDQLPVNVVAEFISFGDPSETHSLIAQDILHNRYTQQGWRNYMYCYINYSIETLNYVVDSICNYARTMSSLPENRILMFFRLFYSCSMILVDDGAGKYNWRYFNNRLWMRVDKLQIRTMLQTRLQICNVPSKLDIQPSKLESIIKNAWYLLSRGEVDSYLFAPTFERDADNKDTIFCMNTCAYDIIHSVIRRQLPSDLCTLAGDIDPDAKSWNENKQEMMDILSTWMGGFDVADSYLDVLACALSEFGPRYAIINSGTGADGKSTFFHIVSKLFGSYCMTMPGTGPSVETKLANEATPVASAMIGKRVYITSDAINIARLLSSPGFKSVSGGDTTYIRRLYREADTNSPRLKALVLINTNQTDFIATSINELTRIRVVKWLTKRITTEDKDIVPRHQTHNSGDVIYRFEQVFITRLGSCMMMDLISRHIHLKSRSMTVDLCPQIRQWTKSVVAPKTILRFLHSCTTTIGNNNNDLDEATSYALSVQHTPTEASVESLYMLYAMWRRNGGRFSATDPTTMETFKTHLEFYYPISTRINSDNMDELYVKGIIIKSDIEFLNNLYPGQKVSNNFNSMLTEGRHIIQQRTNPITYTDNTIVM
jgi:hypothetical protein